MGPKSRATALVSKGAEPTAPVWLGVVLAIGTLFMGMPSGTAQESSNSANNGASSPDEATGRTATSASDTTDLVLWLFRDDDISPEKRQTFRKALRETLSDANRRHLLSDEDLERHIADRTASVPSCLKGTKPCVSPQTLVFDQLGLNAVVRVRLRSTESGLKVVYRLIDRRGTPSESSSLEDDDTESLAFSLVRELFDATGSVTIRSTPSGAAVQIDGKSLGTTPLQTRLPVGGHSFRLRHRNHRPVEGDFELASDGSVAVERELPEKPGRLVVENAPESAAVFVGETQRGSAGTPIELEPGTYKISVRADGYESYDEQLDIDAGKTVRRSVPLESESSLLRDIGSDAIAVNRYVARLTFDQSFHPTSFRDARGSAGGTDYEFEGFTENGASGRDVVRRTLAPRGLRLDLAYTGRHFGVVGMSLSYTATRTERTASFETSDDTERIGTVTGLRRLQLRPLQLTYRRFFKNFVPSIEVGTGITFQWLAVEGLAPDRESPILLNQTEAFWNLGIAGQYFFNPNWFAVLRYSFQDYFNAGKGVEHVISLGAGAAYPDIFGFAPEPPEEL